MKAARGVVCSWIPVLLLAVCARVEASQGYVVSGTVVDFVSGQPLPGIALTLTPDKEGASPQNTLSAKGGQFSFPSVAAGKYILSGSGPGYRAQGLNQHGAFFTGVAVGANLDATNVLFRLQRDASIQGQIIDDQNEPVRNATVQLFKVDDSSGVRRVGSENNAGTNDQGVYHFPRLAPGTYYIAVSARPWYAQIQPHGPHSRPGDAESSARAQEESAQLDVAYASTFYPDAVDSSQANAITLQPGDRASADVAMRAVPAVHLRIRSDGAGQGGQAPGLKQRVFDSLMIPVFGATIFGLSQGVYEVGGLAPGHYVVELSSAATGNAPGGRGWFRDVDVYGDVEISASDSPAMATVTGLVTYEGDAPAPRGNVYVALRNRDSGEEWTSEVSPKGLFGLQNNELHPGTYEVALYNGAKWFVTRIVAQNARVQGSEVTLAPGSSAKLVFTATQVSATITGTVMHDDKPLAGALVLLVPEDAAHHTELYRRDQSDSDGTFTLQQVPPGRYTAVAIQNGWAMEWGNAEVLEPYLAKGEKIIVGDKSANVKLQAQ